ncbi:DNA cytosine methyltransferase [Sanyastnella coralliicola]|uniref:DNA cytosine methyltransferase n=1 Tax=Sanyastnella coralliicola TaxID=3069118 RepID=UPI0027BA3D53|nr:DNA cytosine methyltransferase [Longitalea sp. SCSIO 12813]
MTHGSLFSGIGGFDLAAEWMGWTNLFHCEWNDFGKRVLSYYWPEAESFHDITQTDFTKYADRIDVLTGGFPCQPYSTAGKRKGKEDERHLWPEMLRAIREISPRYVVGENVRGLINWNGGLVFDEVQADLEAEGYEVLPFLLPAAGVNAPHRRDRIWFIAHSNKSHDRRASRQDEGESREERIQKRNEIRESIESGEVFGDATNSKCKSYVRGNSEKSEGVRLDLEGRQLLSTRRHEGSDYAESSSQSSVSTNSSIGRGLQNYGSGEPRLFEQESQDNFWKNFPTQSPIRSGDDGIPSELDGITFSKWRNESIKAVGNAIVPQVALQIFKAIKQMELIKKPPPIH